MGQVTIGGRALEVKQQQGEGGLGLLKRTALAGEKLAASSGKDYPDAAADLVACYVGHNEGVTRDWLLERLPADCAEVLRDCIVASGGKVADPGEAKGP